MEMLRSLRGDKHEFCHVVNTTLDTTERCGSLSASLNTIDDIVIRYRVYFSSVITQSH